MQPIINVDKIEDLVLFDVLADINPTITLQQISVLPIENWGLFPLKWEITKGRKDIRNYNVSNVQNANTAIKIKYFYTFEPNSNVIADYYRQIEYMAYDGTVGMSKVLDKEVDEVFLEELNVFVRKNQVFWLRAQGKELRQQAQGYPPAQQAQAIAFANYIDTLWVLWKDEIILYENLGSGDLLTAVQNYNATNLGVPDGQGGLIQDLDIVDPETGKTMRQIIIDQIT